MNAHSFAKNFNHLQENFISKSPAIMFAAREEKQKMLFASFSLEKSEYPVSETTSGKAFC